MRYEVCSLLANAYLYAQRLKTGGKTINLNPSQEKAVNILLEVLRHQSKVPIGGVQGPPGTGKTTVIESFIYHGVSDYVQDIEGVIVYIAPTNHLAAQAFERVVAVLLARDYTFRDIISIARLYGSKITVKNCTKIFKQFKIGTQAPSSKEAKQIIYDNVDPDTVKIVFATEYQRVSGRLTRKPDKIYLIVDEASKSPYYRAFISVADAIIRFQDYPYTLVALGDPEQAITVPEAFRIRRVPLLMRKIGQILEENGIQDKYVMLDTTYRLPKPSEEPISHGFYDDRLHAHEPASFRLKEVGELFQDMRGRAEALIRNHVGWTGRLEKIFNAIYDAATTHRPIIILQTPYFKSESIAATYDKTRANLGILASLVIEAFITEAERAGSYSIPTTMVTAPYSDIVTNISFNYRQKFGSITRQPRAATVHAVIGGESDFIVTILGKEYSGSTIQSYWRPDDEYKTMYFKEPQVLNVQLSRHHKLLIIIGAVDKLASCRSDPYTCKRISGTAQKLLDLSQTGEAITINM